MQEIVLKHALKGVLDASSGVQVNVLVEILMNTPNPELAIAKLFNEYVEPNIEKHKISSVKRVCTMVSFDPWNNNVHYSYQRNKTKSIYIPKSVDKSDVTYENYEQFAVSWDSNGSTQSISVELPEMETLTEVVSLKTWESWSNYISEGKQRELDAQNMYC